MFTLDIIYVNSSESEHFEHIHGKDRQNEFHHLYSPSFMKWEFFDNYARKDLY